MLVMVWFVERISLLVQIAMSLDVLIFVMSISNGVVHGMTGVFLMGNMVSINKVIILVKNLSVMVVVIMGIVIMGIMMGGIVMRGRVAIRVVTNVIM